MNQFLEMFKDMFSREEWVDVKGRGSDAGKYREFARRWCMKESLVKAHGQGIGLDPGSICFRYGDRGGAAAISIPETDRPGIQTNALSVRLDEALLHAPPPCEFAVFPGVRPPSL